MNLDSIRSFCLSLPHATENVQWGNDLVFKVGGKMFAVANLNRAEENKVSFKCTPEKFAELTEMPGIIPAPYAARYHWVSVQADDALRMSEVEDLIRQSHEMVFAKLPKKVQLELRSTPAKKHKGRKSGHRAIGSSGHQSARG
jgi:predicted DNA-binding protein (MmcQ/YjbR family)